MSDTPFADQAVATTFNAYPSALRRKLLRLRRLIFDVAAKMDDVGPLQETLKWGQPAYLTTQSRSGTTIRIDQVKGEADAYALYVHCQTSLVETFQQHYPDQFTYAGNRAIVFDCQKDIDENALRHCIALALTYHHRKR